MVTTNCPECAKLAGTAICPKHHEARTKAAVELRKAQLVVTRIEKEYGLEGEELKKSVELLKKHNFNFAWGATDEGEALKKMVLTGMKRHGFKDVAKYIRHCIKDTSLREETAGAADHD